MALVLDDEQRMLQDAARGFLSEHAPVSQLRALRDEAHPDGFSRETWKAMADMGWAGVLVPEEHGGVDMGYVAAGLIAEEMGRTLTASPFLSTAVMGAAALRQAGSRDQQARLLPMIAAGDVVIAHAVDEGSKHGPEKVALSASRAGNGFKLDGAKTFVAEGPAADVFIVAARTSGKPGEMDGITLFLVDRDASGLEIERTALADSRGFAKLKLDGVEVTADAVLGEVDQGFGVLEAVLNAGRAGLAAEMSGAGQQVFEDTLAYIKEREQFGEKVGSFQALQHRAAHLFSELELTKSVVMKALSDLDEGSQTAGFLVAAAKAKAGQAARLAAQEAIQMHGGVGMTDEYDVGFFIKRIRVAEALFGDGNFHADRLALLRGY